MCKPAMCDSMLSSAMYSVYSILRHPDRESCTAYESELLPKTTSPSKRTCLELSTSRRES